MLLDSSPAAMNRGGQPDVLSFQRTAYARLLGAGEKQPAFLLIVYTLYGEVVCFLRGLYSECFQMVRPFENQKDLQHGGREEAEDWKRDRWNGQRREANTRAKPRRGKARGPRREDKENRRRGATILGIVVFPNPQLPLFLCEGVKNPRDVACHVSLLRPREFWVEQMNVSA
jgi:hypothetical protein